MFIKRLIRLNSLAIILGAGIMVGCGPSAEEQAANSVALTAAAATDTPKPTPIPTSTPTPTEIPPTLTPSPSHTPTFTPPPEPQVILRRGGSGCEREHDIVASSPIQLHYGIWGSLGESYAEASWSLLDVTLTIDGEEIKGEKQPVAADLVKHCGSDAEDAFWIFYIVNIEGLPPGDYYLEVIYYANGVIEDGFGQNHGPGTILTHSYFLNSSTEE